tara:strand:- start:52 stop:228 length:177 start_codon:yes stop_codon:yes gene_type:complete
LAIIFKIQNYLPIAYWFKIKVAQKLLLNPEKKTQGKIRQENGLLSVLINDCQDNTIDS